MDLFWHRRDPRLRDNAGLAAAAAAADARSDRVVPVFAYDAELLETVGARRRTFLLRTAAALQRRYRERGSDLVVRSGDPAAVLPDLAEEYGAGRVTYNEHYRPARRERERGVESALADAGVETNARTDLVVVDPGRLAGSYPNHGRFRDDWDAVPTPDPYPAPEAGRFADVGGERSVRAVAADASGEPDPFRTDVDLPAAGYRAARDRLDGFLAEGIATYADTRDDLARAVEAPTRAVSRLSPYLAAGAIGIREVWAAATEARDDASDEDARRNVEKYRDELTWREGMYHLLYYAPDLAESNYRSFPNPIAWREDDAGFDAWKRGETGYPLVDAGMRQLEAEGYVHNRPRQVVASFLTKHLLVDWRRGARWFMKRLVDADHASNHGMWQWIASTGTDSVDVRIFDPVSQAAKYDPEATFVREYVPELREVPADAVVDWPTLSPEEREELAPDYPHPIVDRDAAYERAKRVFEEALGKR
ncbi:cryptochrome/photolyase family protein [Halorubrum aethiopicum]|uniref:cryptochrome/photolyase family protein n=1 Tax=Halorubrum aethiopicum TaxID=1758255 RepID=UPI0008309319|nr:deoxyribodipyrimidine photo-lyase [Halorubrum aethiopicum]